MRRKLGIAVVVLAGLAGLSPAVVPPAVSQEGTTPPALVSLTATGTGVESYPAFAPSRRRFGVRTSADTGPITVTATTASPTDELTIAGLPTASGHGRVLRGLKPGEEITVRLVNTDGERIYSLVYLPPSFPEIPITTRQAGIAPGFLYLGFFVGAPFNIVMDNFGVPVYVNRRTQPPFDFKPQPGGRYTFLERSGAQTSTGRDIFEAVVLNSAMREVRRFRTRPPLANTDNHDVLLLPGGNRILLAYEPVVHDGVVREDSVIQEVDAGGHEVLRWSSWGDIPLADNLSGNLVEYAHINSVFVDTDGNLIASLRGVSALVKINRETGELMWTLGGRSSDFAMDDPLGGFCGQHHAQRLPNGHILLFDNGADCAPGGADRGVSRAAEYAVDEVNHTAELVWSHSQGLYGFATGSVQRFDNGNTLIGWGTAAVITEVDETGQILFETAPRAAGGTTPAVSYRAHRAPFPDGIPPRVVLATPPGGTTYLQGQPVRANYFCTDEGGSSVAGCDGSVRSGAFLDTSTPGVHTLTVTATDGAGNTKVLSRDYTVRANQPDVAVRLEPGGRLVGNNVYNRNGEGQTRIGRVRAGGQATFTVQVENDGVDDDTFLIHGSDHDANFAVRYYDGDRDVTTAVKDGSYRLRGMHPHTRHRLQVEVTARAGAASGADIDVYVVAKSLGRPASRDSGRLVTRLH